MFGQIFKKIKFIVFLLVSFLFVGCTTSQVQYIPYTSSVTKSIPKRVSSAKIYTGYIKGKVQQVTYNQLTKEWEYEVLGSDISNGKLPYAKFVAKQKVANEGDKIYAKILKSKLEELFFTQKIQVKKQPKQKNLNKKKIKNKKIPKISVPTTEEILLD